MVSYWAQHMAFEQNKISIFLMYCPWILDVLIIHRQMLPLWLTLMHVRFGLWQCERSVVIFWSNARLVSWIFSGILQKMGSEPSILEVNILQWNALWAVLYKIYTIWGYFAFPHEWKRGKIIIKHRMESRWDMISFWVEKYRYWYWMKWWVAKIDICTWSGFPLG